MSPFNNVEDKSIADNYTEQGEVIGKEKKRKVVDEIYQVKVQSKEVEN
jgi:hypothetical protein